MPKVKLLNHDKTYTMTASQVDSIRAAGMFIQVVEETKPDVLLDAEAKATKPQKPTQDVK